MWCLPTEHNARLHCGSLIPRAKNRALGNQPTDLPNELHLRHASLCLSIALPVPWGASNSLPASLRGAACKRPGRTQREQRKIANMLALLLRPPLVLNQ